MMPSDSIALRAQAIDDLVDDLHTFDDPNLYDTADLRDSAKRLREATDGLVDLLNEAVVLLSGHEGDALVRQDIPTIPDDPIEVHATTDELLRLHEAAQEGDQAALVAALDQITAGLDPEAAGLLHRQLVAAGAATLLELLDEDLDSPDDAEPAVG